jgi:PD-(D/E)XK endonuclease
MIANTTHRGKATEAIILSILTQLGKSVLIPWGEERYDLAIDDVGRLIRIQCKTGVLRKGCVVFKTCITDARRPQGDGGYAGQINAFAVFCPELNTAYLVPIDALPSPFWGYLRVEPTLNGQTRCIRWAREFELRLPHLSTPADEP